MSKSEITVQGPASATAYTRERRYGRKDGAAVDLHVYRSNDGKGYRVSWNANRGRGWMKGWRSKRYATEAEALAFADEKWTQMLAWLEKVEPVAGVTAAEIFSASLVGMR